MVGFLFGHFSDFVLGRAVFHQGHLPGIDSYRAEFTGMVDADRALQYLAGRQVTGQVMGGGLGHTPAYNTKRTNAKPPSNTTTKAMVSPPM